VHHAVAVGVGRVGLANSLGCREARVCAALPMPAAWVIAYSVLCVFLVVHTEPHAMTPFYLGGTPSEISSYTTRRDATLDRDCFRRGQPL
jgi:hypothetical protein